MTTSTITNVQEATRSSSCAAEACENDAEPRHHLCWRCAKKDSVRLHVQPERITSTLPCCTCKRELDDDHFSHKSDAKHRRYRHHECRDCTRTRRTLRKPIKRSELPSAEQDRLRAKGRAESARRRARNKSAKKQETT